MKIMKQFLIFLGIILFFGCYPDHSSQETPALTDASISIAKFSTDNNLEVANSAGGYLFTRTGVRLQIFPHLNYIRYNGRTIRIPDAPFVTDGELFIPLSILKSLPDSFTPRQVTSEYLVLLDPGHGGEDTGAISGSALEKDIVLDIARRTQRLLAGAGISSELTRKGDYFITLDERSRIANKHPGAIFVSIHANAESTGNAEGIETFFLTSKISDRQRARWAATAYDFNTASGQLNDSMELIAAEKMSHNTRSDSRLLAQYVQGNIIENMHENDRGVKQENFSVLRESFFGPAILVETGFITHPASRTKLMNPAYRQRVAESISKGIILYTQSK